MPKMESEPLHPAWKKCKIHELQYSGVSMVPNSPHMGMITLRVNCTHCGCPGETIVDVLSRDIEWKTYHNSTEVDNGNEQT